jgi:short-subunit dehydrogenase
METSMKMLKGTTALVTGASGGIGAAIARRLAAEGVNLVLVARSADKLAVLAAELAAMGVSAEAVTADLSLPGAGAALASRIATVDILINNAGFGSYGLFERLADADEQRQIAVNIAALVSLTHAFLPGMIARGRGVILNLASTAAFQPAPFMATYAATKAFVLSFSTALWAELRDRGVHVVALCPGATETAFIDGLGDPSVRHTSVFARPLPAVRVADEAVRALIGRQPVRIVGWKNRLLAGSTRLLPLSTVAKVGAGMLRPAASPRSLEAAT